MEAHQDGQGLEHLPYGVGAEGPGLVCPQEGKPLWDLSRAFWYPGGGHLEDRARLLTGVHSRRKNGS